MIFRSQTEHENQQVYRLSYAPILLIHGDRSSQSSSQSSLMRGGLGNRSLPKHRVVNEVLENRIQTRQEKSMYFHCTEAIRYLLSHAKNKQSYIEGGPRLSPSSKLTY